jgi:asparagine synthase (glutamine-hydrolysing)
LRNRSDAELVLRSYEQWGQECLAHIDGDFALVIWDARRRTAFCSRDRLGNRPFNYHWDGNTLTFASELHAILAAPWICQALNEGTLAEYLSADWYSNTETFWKGIHRLAAANTLNVGLNAIEKSTYWQPSLYSDLPCETDAEYVEYYKQLLSDVVRRTTRSHWPVAFDVSGGLDSSGLFCVAEKLRREQRLETLEIQGYSFSAVGDPVFDEVEFSRAVGLHLDRKIEEVAPSVMPASWYQAQGSLYQEFPGFVNGTMITGLRARARDDGSRVVITGEGGDQWLSGEHTYYAEMLAERRWRQLIASFSKDARAAGARVALSWLLRSGVVPSLPGGIRTALRTGLHKLRGDVSSTSEQSWLSPGMKRLLRDRQAEHDVRPILPVRRAGQRTLLLDLYDPFFTQVMERSERLASMAGVEIRHPLRSQKIVQFAFSVPERLRRQGPTNKVLHRRALRGIAPEEVVERSTKAGSDGIFRRHLLPLASDFLERIPDARKDWVSPESLRTLFRRYQSDNECTGSQWALWGVAACDFWLS